MLFDYELKRNRSLVVVGDVVRVAVRIDSHDGDDANHEPIRSIQLDGASCYGCTLIGFNWKMRDERMALYYTDGGPVNGERGNGVVRANYVSMLENDVMFHVGRVVGVATVRIDMVGAEFSLIGEQPPFNRDFGGYVQIGFDGAVRTFREIDDVPLEFEHTLCT